MNPVVVAVCKMKEANKNLADMAGKVSNGFTQCVMNLGVMIREVVQADVEGGVINYQLFFSAEFRAQSSKEENRFIEILKLLMLDEITLLEYALFVHAQTDKAKLNATFHNSLANSFLMYRKRVEGLLGTAKSILPEEASIYVVEHATIGESRSNALLNTLLAGGIGAMPSRVGRSQSLSESQNKQLLSASASAGSGGGAIQLRPLSAISSNSSWSSYTTTASGKAEMESIMLDKITKRFCQQFLESSNEGICMHELNWDLFMCLTLCGKKIAMITIKMMTLPKMCSGWECHKLTLPDCSKNMDSLIKFIQCTDAPELIVKKINFIFLEPCKWPNFVNIEIEPLEKMMIKHKEVVYDITSSNFMELRAKLILVPNHYEMELKECRLEMV